MVGLLVHRKRRLYRVFIFDLQNGERPLPNREVAPVGEGLLQMPSAARTAFFRCGYGNPEGVLMP
jgi:hypothetical protein